MKDKQNKLLKKSVFVILILICVVLVIGGAILLTSDNNQTESAVKYINEGYGFTLEIPSSWIAEPQPTFIDGVMIYNGKNISFYSEQANLGNSGFTIIIEDNEMGITNASEYVDYLIEENMGRVASGDYTFVWEYLEHSNISLGSELGHIIKELKGPDGYQDVIYIVNENYSYQVSYSEVNSEGIYMVNEPFRQQIQDVLNSFTFI